MKSLNVLPYILFFSCISLLNAQKVSQQDSIHLQKSFDSLTIWYDKLSEEIEDTKQDSTSLLQYYSTSYREHSVFYNKLESYQLNYQEDSHWSNIKGEVLQTLYYDGFLAGKDSSLYYKNLINELDYIPPYFKMNTLINENQFIIDQTNNNELFLENTYKIQQALQQHYEPAIDAMNLLNLAKFHILSNNIIYAEDALVALQDKVQFLNDYNTNDYFNTYVKFLIEQENFSKAKSILSLYPQKTDIIWYEHLLRSKIYFFGDHNLAAAKQELHVYEKKYAHLEHPELLIFKAELAHKEKRYREMLSILAKANQRNVDSYIFKSKRLLKILRLTSLAYEHLNQPQQALVYHKKYKRTEDSIKAIQKQQQFVQANFRLKKDQELQQLVQANLERQLASEQSQKQARLYIFGLIILMFLGIAGVYYFKTKKNLQTRLALENARHMAHMKNNLIENLSHEFRTPLTIILGYLDLIKQRTTHPEKISQYAKTAITNGNRLIQGLNDLLSLLRIDTEKTNIKSLKKSDNLGDFISNLVEGFATVAQMNDVKLFYQSNLLSNQTTIEFEYDHLTKILNNLISNAIKFSKSNGSVYVSSILTKKNLEICVKDDGIGISKSELNKIFDRFYQSEKHSHSGGFGIGLSLVKSLVEFLHGTMDVKSKKDTGTQFKVSIPLVLENRDLYIQTTSEYIELTETLLFDEHPSTKKNSNLPKVLILEDHFEMSLFFKELLAPYLQCTWVRHGKAALKKLEQEQFDLIISDLKMPVMDGFEFKAALNRLIDHRNTPYLMVSASPIDFKVEERTQLKIDEYIMKPFSDRELISRVRLLLKKKLYKKQVLQLDKGEAVQFEGNFSEFMEKVNTVILDNLHNSEFNVKKLASSCGYSERHFSRLLQSKTGMTPVKIILEIKLLKAYEMLKSGKRQTIAEVIYESGFNDRSYFYRAFSKRFGIKPSELHGISSLQSIGMN
jgi:signal transduction histidine kinase/AraC-like DNA-binding protein